MHVENNKQPERQGGCVSDAYVAFSTSPPPKSARQYFAWKTTM